ncbi:uncharacterized protein BJ171DRAFT_61505 [Polychytrium aggregatum]|uniref:uncharacterized protein n=1 Tax=Polychytrium aggregatum TaxID=110093 RepID=UPI0022FDECF1|nr:uncharacterized protein BJ171DRAFT_61505 [Polychytrium aggregatum]KAI9205468.1 hypothetical protein BJ171DRAFT_61505 [Polychytrium aggregatum]
MSVCVVSAGVVRMVLSVCMFWDGGYCGSWCCLVLRYHRGHSSMADLSAWSNMVVREAFRSRLHGRCGFMLTLEE